MSLTEDMYNGTKDIWDKYLVHPFILQMASGELPIEKYKRYMLEDYAYLKEYVRILDAGINNSVNSEEVVYLGRHKKETCDEIQRVHIPYMKRLGITDNEIETYPMSDVLKNYTEYMIKIASEGKFLDVINVILSCSWSYAYICNYFTERGMICADSLYKEWFDSYACTEYNMANDGLIKMVEEYGLSADEVKRKSLSHVFRKCSEYELEFWDYLSE